jgi:formate/nitrite transporter FocA (FNT family)
MQFAGTCGPIGRIAILERSEYEYEYRDAEYEYEKKHETMWCTVIAGGAFLTFSIVVSGDIGDHGRPMARISPCN